MFIQKDYDNIGKTYNDALDKIKSGVVIFIHHAVFLPYNWERQLIYQLKKLENLNWGVLGVAGAVIKKGDRKFYGHLYSRKKYDYRIFCDFKKVQTLDELMLITNKNNDLYLDENIPTWHFYGTDLCL